MRKQALRLGSFLLLIALLFLSRFALAGSPAESAASTSEQDHDRLMHLLGISSLRRGADGTHPDAPNAANYDESKASPYTKLPDVLTTEKGRPVKTARMWWSRRRPELVEIFNREIYGRMPANTPPVHWEVTSTNTEQFGSARGVTRHLLGHVENSSYPAVSVDIQLTITAPPNAAHAPVILDLIFVRRPGMPVPPPVPGPTWQEMILSRGWAYATLIPTSVQPDSGAGLTQGIIGLVNKGQPRRLDDWGALSAWGWGASRALDYFQTDPSLDAHHVAIAGHSRYGKAALLAMASDPRFSIALVTSSGEGGAKLHRRTFGELLENVAAPSEYHWMAGNFLRYAGPLTANDLPVDSHELIALCAPRPVFIGVGTMQGDGWADPRGMFLAEVAAGPVYELLGAKGLKAAEFPAVGTVLDSGDLAFLQHSGGHTPVPNWPAFLNFAQRYFAKPGT